MTKAFHSRVLIRETLGGAVRLGAMSTNNIHVYFSGENFSSCVEFYSFMYVFIFRPVCFSNRNL